MERIINVDGKEMKMVANALVPRKYRNMFQSDMILDMQTLVKAYNKGATEGTPIPFECLTIFENVAWLFLKEGGEDVKDSPDEWLASLESMFSVYEVMPQIVELWGANNKTTSTPSGKK